MKSKMTKLTISIELGRDGDYEVHLNGRPKAYADDMAGALREIELEIAGLRRQLGIPEPETAESLALAAIMSAHTPCAAAA